jgi:hypothetical protein
MDDDADIWSQFKMHFPKIIADNEYYNKRLNFLRDYDNNVLLYGPYGFPTDLFINEVIKAKFELNALHKSECIWNKDVPYYHNPHFLEINLMHPLFAKNVSNLCPFLTHIIKTRNVSGCKHLIIIKHIDLLDKDNSISYRIILERFSSNAYFLCTTHNIDRIDLPIKSRFSLIRMPLFSHAEIKTIFDKYLGRPINKHLAADKHMRDIIKALYLSDQEHSADLVNLKFPPVVEFVNKKKKCTLTDVRQFAYKCFQYNISISDLVHDLLILCPNSKKIGIITVATDIEYKSKLVNKGREAIYIEAFLCKVMLG